MSHPKHPFQSRSKIILLVWICVLSLAFGKLFLWPTALTETELSGAEGTEAWQVAQILKTDFDLRLGGSLALVSQKRPLSEETLAQFKTRFPEIKTIRQLHGNRPHQTQLYQLLFNTQMKINRVHSLTAEIRDWLKKHVPDRVWITGNAAFQHDAKSAGKKESRQSEMIALLLSFFILILNFGSVTAAFLPILMGASTLVSMHALVQILGMPLNPVARILSTLVGLALAIDYSLFMVSRYREESKKVTREEALKTTLYASGKTILFSALIMLISIAVLLIPNVSLSRTVMASLLVVIVLSLVHALFILPALLYLGQSWLNFPRGLSSYFERINTYPFWSRFSSHVTGHARRYFVLSTLILIALSWPVFSMKLWDPVQAVAPRDSESLQGYQVLQADHWGGELIPVTLVLKAPSNKTAFDPEALSQLSQVLDLFKGDATVGDIKSLLSWSPNMKRGGYEALYQSMGALNMLYQNDTPFAPLVNRNSGHTLSLIHIFPRDLMALDDTRHILAKIRGYQAKHPEMDLLVGGTVARIKDFTHELYRHTPLILSLMGVGIYFLLAFYMRSVILPLKAALMNFLPIMSAFGILTLIFQYGWGSTLLGTPVNQAVTNIVPLVLFCIIFGLSMDYEVLILSRISEEYERTKNVHQAVVEGLARSGGVITGAVLILLGVFLPGTLSSSPQTQEICIGISVAIFLDATLVRLFLVPSFMMLMGKWNWWHPWQKDLS